MAKTLRFEWFFPHEKEVVWECLTTQELISEWLMANDFQPRVGHKFEFRAKPQPGWNGITYCTVLEVLPYSRLSYTWESGPKPGEINMSTVVTWTLTEHPNGTKLDLVHDGFTGLRGFFVGKILGKGWKTHIADSLVKVVSAQSKKKNTVA